VAQMNLDEYIAWLEQAIDRVDLGAAAMANAMAEYLADRIANDMLRRTTHSPGAYFKARPGAPPASASGNLARSMFTTPAPASRGLRATAYVGNNARYAKLMEHGGCVLRPTSHKVMHWRDSEGSWYHPRLPASGDFPAHPFMEPAVQEAIDDGSLLRVALEAFLPYDP
jgi:phage gpG-like protein